MGIKITYDLYDFNGLKCTYLVSIWRKKFRQELIYLRDDLKGKPNFIINDKYYKELNFDLKSKYYIDKITGDVAKQSMIKKPGGWTVDGFSSKYQFSKTNGCSNGFPVIEVYKFITAPSFPAKKKQYIYSLIYIPAINEFLTTNELTFCGALIFKQFDDLPLRYRKYCIIDRIELIAPDRKFITHKITSIDIDEDIQINTLK